MGLPPDQVTGDLNAAADYVLNLPAVNGTLVVAGFCWGGGQAFRFATSRKDLKAALVFYGSPPAKDALAKITSPVYGFYGENDARINMTIKDTFNAMKNLGKTYEAVIYTGAGHGFMRAGEEPDASKDNAFARKNAWLRVEALVERNKL